jgi:hypothetical protein
MNEKTIIPMEHSEWIKGMAAHAIRDKSPYHEIEKMLRDVYQLGYEQAASLNVFQKILDET